MEIVKNRQWDGVAVSLIGQAHVRAEKPCQDASGFWDEPRPIGIVCDGAGSADRSEVGAKAAVAAFRRAVGVFEPWLECCLDGDMPEEVAGTYWRYICSFIARTLEEAKLECTREDGYDEEDYDFTVAMAVVGKTYCGCFQIGDGAIVVGDSNAHHVVFMPDKGEYANETRFLRIGDGVAGRYKSAIIPMTRVDSVALMSDGPIKLLVDGKSQQPSNLFQEMFCDLANGLLSREEVREFLACRKWIDIGADDDKSLVLMVADVDSGVTEMA